VQFERLKKLELEYSRVKKVVEIFLLMLRVKVVQKVLNTNWLQYKRPPKTDSFTSDTPHRYNFMLRVPERWCFLIKKIDIQKLICTLPTSIDWSKCHHWSTSLM
tara:strand:- start:435 stop:746 length:312 start_codon:yes stop_codon:yes gene_type:complete